MPAGEVEQFQRRGDVPPQEVLFEQVPEGRRQVNLGGVERRNSKAGSG